jgi:2,4-dienoyl-CoA reductase-like NADH-dependent reductase (Old Yellow Enzyme family)
MAGPAGEITDQIIARYRRLARGEIALIIPGYMYVHPSGRTNHRQIGIYSDHLIPGLQKLAEAIHQEGGKAVFQPAHAGRQTTRKAIGERTHGYLVNQFLSPYLNRRKDV